METPENTTPPAHTFKVGDPVGFEHIGYPREGIILEICEDGKIRMQDKDGYRYKYSPQNVWPAGSPPPPKENQQQSNTNNQKQNEMTTKTNVAPKKDAAKNGNGVSATPKKENGRKEKATRKPEKAPLAEIPKELKEQILALKAKRQDIIYLLHAEGLTRQQVAELAVTNAGAVGNTIKLFNREPERIAKAKALLAAAQG